MSLLETLTQQLAGDNLSALSKQLGIDEKIASTAISAALPMIVGAMARNASTEKGAEGLSNALQKDHDGGIMDNLGGFLGSSDNGAGAAILGHVFGNKQQDVQQGIGKMSGLDSGMAGALLENLAPVVMGALGSTQRSKGLDAGGLASMLGGESKKASGGTSSMAMDMLSGMLDQDNDGSVIDDIGGMLGRFMK